MKTSKGGKSDEKGAIMEPMFPRLLFSDREKGGPRAPPRNKMALYEQLCIPSKRSTPQDSAIQSNGHKKTVLSPFNMSSTAHSKSDDRVLSRSSDRASLNTTSPEFRRSFKRHANGNIANSRGPECNSENLSGSSDARKPRENIEDDDDLRVPIFSRPEISATQAERPQKPSGEKDMGTISTNYERNSKKTSASTHSRKTVETLSQDPKSSDLATISDVVKRAFHASKELRLQSRFSNRVNAIQDEGNSINMVETCPPSLADRENHDESNNQLEHGDEERDDVSDDSMDSISAMMISPDNVVGVIGTKHFWKARRAIVNQQRVFSIQVFELHRLIKVQKLIAASPEVIKPDLPINPSPPKPVPEEDPPLERSQPTIEQNDITEKTIENTVKDQETVDAARESAPNTCVFNQPPTQWLVPVMSPSEGLIYKPYSGPFPPMPGFMPPIYGGCVPMGFQPMGISAQNGFPGNFYNAPMNASMFSNTPQNDENTKNSEVVSSVVREGQDADSCQRDEGSRVIKVVPHNALSTRESAKRIFLSIQKERQQQFHSR